MEEDIVKFNMKDRYQSLDEIFDFYFRYMEKLLMSKELIILREVNESKIIK